MFESGLSREKLLGKEKGSQKISVLDVLLIVFILLIAINAVVRTFFFSPVLVDGSSMESTLQNGDWLVMYKSTEVTYGDVAVIRTGHDSSGDVYYIKRVIGLPGDIIFTIDGEVYRKSKGESEPVKIDEPYAKYLDYVGGVWVEDGDGGTYRYDSYGNEVDLSPVEVGEGKIFFMGDNRKHSKDSREIGVRKFEDVIGVIPRWSIEYRKSYAWYYETTYKVSNFIKKSISKLFLIEM